jgi:hypothetical protein
VVVAEELEKEDEAQPVQKHHSQAVRRHPRVSAQGLQSLGLRCRHQHVDGT